MTLKLFVALCALALLGACGRQAEQTPAPRVQAALAQPSSESQPVPPQVNITPAAPASAPPVQALASGSFGKGAAWHLTRAKVTGAILSVELQIERTAPGCENEYVDLAQVSYIDDGSAKKFGVLKDDAGQWLAGPLVGTRVQAKACGGTNRMWVKFPAPPPDSKTVTLNLAQLGTFDSIAVQR